MSESEITTPGFNICGGPIVPKEEQIELEDIELSKFLVERGIEKKRISTKKTISKPVKLSNIAQMVKNPEDKDSVMY